MADKATDQPERRARPRGAEQPTATSKSPVTRAMGQVKPSARTSSVLWSLAGVIVAIAFFSSLYYGPTRAPVQVTQTPVQTQAAMATAPSPVVTPAAPLTPQLTPTLQPFSFDDAGVTLIVTGGTSMEICFYPLPDEGNYTFRHADGTVWARGKGKPTTTAFLQAPTGERREIHGKMAPLGAC